MRDYRFTMLRPAAPIHDRIPEDISSIVLDPHVDHLWLGTYQGLFKYDIRSGEYHYVESGVGTGQEISIYNLYQDPPFTYHHHSLCNIFNRSAKRRYRNISAGCKMHVKSNSTVNNSSIAPRRERWRLFQADVHIAFAQFSFPLTHLV